MLETVLIVGAAAAFVVSAIDYWVDLGFWRPVIAFLFGAVLTVLQGPPQDLWGFALAVTMSLAAAFTAMAMIKIVERMNIIQTRMR